MQAKVFILLAAGFALLARPAAAHCNYVVEEGDSLSDIANWNDVNETALQQLNPQITNTELIYEGDVVRLPCEGGDDIQGNSIYDLLQHRSDMFYLFSALQAVGMLDDLKDKNLDATLFAPTDAAFGKLLQTLNLTAGALLNNTALVKDVLAYHVIPGDSLTADDLEDGESYETMLQGKNLEIEKTDDAVNVLTVAGQSVPVQIADADAGDATVHIIGDVLLPLERSAVGAPIAAPVPKAPAPAIQPVNCTYTAVAGDSLFDIAAKVNSTLDQIVALNPDIEDPELIQIGQKVKVC